METTTHCAYNLTRRVVLSEHLVTIHHIRAPEQLLTVVLNGPGRDPNASVWLTDPDTATAMPRLFAFDVAYLNEQQGIVETAAVGPGTPFPPVSQKVDSILFLSDQSLSRSGTAPGDLIKICTESELTLLRKDPSPFDPVQPQPQASDTFAVHAHPKFTEPFSASLIYLPSSGSPQSSEFFLPAEPPSSLEPNGSNHEKTHPAQLGSVAPEPIEQPPIPSLHSEPNHHPEIKPGKPAASPALPANLRAVLLRVDEQIHSEDTAHGLRHFPEQSTHPAESQLPQPRLHQRSEDPSFDSELAKTQAPPHRSETVRDHPPQNIPVHVDALPTPALKSKSLDPPASVRQSTQVPLAPDSSILPSPSQNSTGTEPPLAAGSNQLAQEVKAPAEHPSSAELEPIGVLKKEKLSFATRVQRWLSGESTSLSGNRRRGERFSLPGLVAFYWTGGAPTPHEIVNISRTGLYLRSKTSWLPDTLVRMTLERQDAEWEKPESISILARVVRSDHEGVAHEFIMTEVLENLRVRDFLPEHGTNRRELEKFLALP